MPRVRPADDVTIREQAYYFWEQDGRPEGRETEYWHRALISLSEKSLSKPAPKKAKALADKPKAAAKLKAAPKLKAAASKAKGAPVKAEPLKKLKKK